MNPQKIILSCQNVCKTYQEGDLETPVLHNINLEVQASETLAIIGASGSGKSTLLHLLGGLDSPTSGEIFLQNQNLKKLNTKEIGILRNQNLGFVYQFHHLLGDFSALENVMMPLLIQNLPKKQAEQRAQAKLEQVGLAHRMAHRPSELSGGERQRAAIARALVTEPACILADEPTGNLDTKNAAAVWEMLCELNRAQGSALIVVTHDLGLASQMSRQVTLKNGILADLVA